MKKLISFAFLAAFLWSCSSDGPNYETLTMTFEHVPEAARAVNAHADNAYDGYAGTQYITYSDASTGLTWGINIGTYDGKYNLWNGGVIVSNFTDRQTETYHNQCSVNWGTDGANSNGGRSNSKYFAVVTGYDDSRTSISVTDPARPVEFKSMYICNTTYVTKVVESEGYGNIPAASKGWLKAVITGYNGAAATGTVEHYLVDYRTAGAPGIVEGWKKVDLTPLGEKVTKLVLEVQGSNNDPDYGLRTPAYFCIDDLTFRREESE